MINTIKTLARTAPLVHPGRRPKSILKQSKHCLRGVAFIRLTRSWFEILQRPELAVISGHHPYLYQKLQRPYLNRTLNTRRRFQALQQHYRFVVAAFSPLVRREIYATPGKLLAALPLDGVGKFGLRLSCSRQEKEGDLMIGLVNLDTGSELFTLAFSITRFAAEPREIFIGGLQGNKLSCDKQQIIALTRSCHGLRPKALLLFAVQTLAAVWSVARLRAVSDAMHIYRHWQKRRRVASSYDQWWLESGGQPAADGMFDLPAVFVPRDLASLKANKRPVYRRRHLLLDDIANQIEQAFRRPIKLSAVPMKPLALAMP